MPVPGSTATPCPAASASRSGRASLGQTAREASSPDPSPLAALSLSQALETVAGQRCCCDFPRRGISACDARDVQVETAAARSSADFTVSPPLAALLTIALQIRGTACIAIADCVIPIDQGSLQLGVDHHFQAAMVA